MPNEPDGDGRTNARGVVARVVPLEFEETVARLVAAIEGRGLRLFDVIDHREAARAAGLELRPTRVLIFGSPVAGTPLMDRSPLLALELPLRILVWRGDDERVRVGHLDPAWLVDQFGLDPGQAGPLGAPAALIAAALGEA